MLMCKSVLHWKLLSNFTQLAKNGCVPAQLQQAINPIWNKVFQKKFLMFFLHKWHQYVWKSRYSELVTFKTHGFLPHYYRHWLLAITINTKKISCQQKCFLCNMVYCMLCQHAFISGNFSSNFFITAKAMFAFLSIFK